MWSTPSSGDVLSEFLPADRAKLQQLQGAIAGTVAVTAGSTAVVGTGTAFTQLVAGQSVTIAGILAVIQSIANDTHLTLSAPFPGATLTAARVFAIDNLPAILARVVAKIRGAVRSGGYDLDADTTKIPGDLFDECVAMTVWRFVKSTPNQTLATKPREDANKAAEDKLNEVASQKYVPEPPTGGTTDRGGAWNSENKLVPRTHPVPPPATQFQQQTPNDYANPTGPEDI